MQGNHLTMPPKALPNPGDYWKVTPGNYWMACTPDGRLANLSRHQVVENNDNTITVTPSILVSGGQVPGDWHGYLTGGIWKEC